MLARQLIERVSRRVCGKASRVPLSVQAQIALRLAPQEGREPQGRRIKLGDVSHPNASGHSPPSVELFSIGGELLPCWLESDFDPDDPWLTASSYYPTYYQVFKQLAERHGKLRILEIGVRTGYMGVVFARATAGRQCFYVGLDPNLYVTNGLELAASSFRAIQQECEGFEFALIEGYSWDEMLKRSLAYTGPFDIVHIDGDHSLPGKLNDLDLARYLIRPGATVLVDDYDHHSIVADAVRRALALEWYREFEYVETIRGLAVLR